MESTLAAQFKDLTGDVGFFLGFGRGADNGGQAWDADQQATIDRCVKGGLRNVYHCGFPWSFLKPMATLTLPEGEVTVPLPDDYGSVEGQITLAADSGVMWSPIDFTGVGRVYAEQNRLPDSSGRPVMVCQEPLKGTGSGVKGQRWQLHFWPTADADYTIQFMYYLNPDYLSGAKPFVYGGPQHAETFLESCLALAERVVDDSATVHNIEFDKRLQISQVIDGRNKAQLIGYNADYSELKRQGRYGWNHYGSRVTFNGILY